MHPQIILTGNVGTDIELHGGGSQEWTYANFRLAHTPRNLRNGVWHDGPTLWVSVSCKNKVLAENVKASIGKGDPVIVSGRLTVTTFTKDDHTVERLLIEASSVGHDLSRGTSAFRRNERSAVPEPVEPEPDRDDGPDSAADGAATAAA